MYNFHQTPAKGLNIVYGMDTMSRGKRSVSVDLKQPEGINIVRKLCSKADVIIEPFRKGILYIVFIIIFHIN